MEVWDRSATLPVFPLVLSRAARDVKQPPVMRRRTRAREIAVQYLYQLDLRRESELRDLDDFLETECKDRDARAFAKALIEGTHRRRVDIDAVLVRVARNWDLSRMAVIDRNILRMAIHEILHRHDIPPKVTINEAIELGKKFSTANSGSFINGILDRVRLDDLAAEPGVIAGSTELGAEGSDAATRSREVTGPEELEQEQGA